MATASASAQTGPELLRSFGDPAALAAAGWHGVLVGALGELGVLANPNDDGAGEGKEGGSLGSREARGRGRWGGAGRGGREWRRGLHRCGGSGSGAGGGRVYGQLLMARPAQPTP